MFLAVLRVDDVWSLNVLLEERLGAFLPCPVLLLFTANLIAAYFILSLAAAISSPSLSSSILLLWSEGGATRLPAGGLRTAKSRLDVGSYYRPFMAKFF